MTDAALHEVLACYATLPRGDVGPLSDHGGFSDATLWRIDTSQGSFCFKVNPSNWRSSGDLTWIHGLMKRGAGLGFVPQVVPTSDGQTFVQCQGRLCELTTWMPGVADFLQAPSPARLEAAVTALAQLHAAWKPVRGEVRPCPAVERRLESWRLWTSLLQSGWRPMWTALDPFRDLAERLWQSLQEHADTVPSQLTPWLARPVLVQPCLCDVWHDHVLFTENRVTGIVDYGSVKVDHVDVDLARLLGSMVGNEDAMWQVGLAAYDRLNPLTGEEHSLARVLDRTGVLVAASHWLRWLYHEGRLFPQPERVVVRLQRLYERLGAFK